ncbi:hypothetical protein SAMN05421813_1021 [Daejeonella rubra]|uniref:Uncharacterized protein n=1 Tax=Daejeonella rubra TaxID=990371 RepID=A0A1G9MKX8_9SPHI|nr:hypothetical protein [Daejeonella rubra]SDL74305.1 hypothetical protein SAMN05421813_1021 [Daejeonella rubra]
MATEKLNDKLILVEGLKMQIDGIRMISNLLKSAIVKAVVSNEISVTKTAVCASNVQIAANSIVRLASDMGSISNIISAGDSGSDLHELCKKSIDQINKTAKKAEIASQLAMEASIFSSEVSLNIVGSSIEKISGSIQNLLNVHFSAPDSFLSELLVHPIRIRKVPEKLLAKSGLNHELELKHNQSLVDLWQSELAVVTEIKNAATFRVERTKERAELFKQVKQDIFALQMNGMLAQSELIEWSIKMKSLFHEMKAINRDLKVAFASVRNLSELVVRKKAINPLISDELISIIVQAIQDSDKAAALFSIALKSTFAASPDKLLKESSILFGCLFYLAETEKNSNWSNLQDFIANTSKKSESHLIAVNKAGDLIVEQLKVANEDLSKAVMLSTIEESASRAIQAAKGI